MKFLKLKKYVNSTIPPSLAEIIEDTIEEVQDNNGYIAKDGVQLLCKRLGILDPRDDESQGARLSNMRDQSGKDFLFQNIITLLFPEGSVRVDQNFLRVFTRGLVCPNNDCDDYRNDGYDSEKQLYLMWTIQAAKETPTYAS